MDKRAIKVTALSLLAATAVGLFSAYGYNLNNSRSQSPAGKTLSDVPVSSDSEDEATGEYMLRAYNGRLAVFMKGESEPQMIFDIPIKTLPEYDRRELEAGISVRDYQSLVALIEDYIS